ncbi:histidine kinase N-terminal 7TM domain-containing protein [Haloferax sp. Atlit-12N]|uniref:sensor histidine kinase n=2 Tax=unclassified Haloferax TaxID=2625095 RepID=UPI001F28B1A1|nr:histidine kinase N-terminal 7TM domain-containing protein [Haloferax sp. Atlit-12N]
MISPSTASLLEACIGCLCLVVAGLSWQYRDRPAGTPLFMMGVTAAIWAFATATASFVAAPNITWAAQFVVYGVAALATVAWFYAVVEYTGHTWWKTTRVRAVVFGLVLFEWVSIVTNPLHQWYISAESSVSALGLLEPTPGLLLYVHAAWKLGLVVVGLHFAYRQAATRRRVVKTQSRVLFLAGVLPVGTALLELFDVVTIPGFDFGVTGIAVGAGLSLWALFEADFLDFVPIARETLLENMNDAVLAIDMDARVVDFNRQAKLLFDIPCDAIGSTVETVFSSYPALSLPDLYETRAPVEIAADIDGQLRYYELDVSQILPRGAPPTSIENAAEQQIGHLFVFRDVTDRKRREHDIEAQNQRLKQFASVVSHDLRNPLNVAQGWLAVERDARDTDSLATVARAHDRMEALIEELLLLARAGREIDETESFELATLAFDAWSSIDAAHSTLVVNTDQRLDVDRSRFLELLENVFRNAVEHGGTGVQITVGDLPDHRGFYVADTGRGIPVEQREQVFENGYSTNREGTGLGLAIVAEVASAHGWETLVTESDAGGARFEFVIASGHD